MAGPLPPLQSNKTRFTNPGIPLISEYRGGESDTVREIPPEWRAALDLHVTEQSIPFDQNLFELTDEILASKTERTVTSEQKIRTTRKPAGVFTLLEKFTNKDKIEGERTRKFRFIDDYPSALAISSATKDVSTRNFGNKHFEEIVEEIPDIFDAESFSVERPIVTPEDFRALLQEHEHCITEEGDAAEPTLVAGDISRTDTQQDLFLHRECRKYIDTSGLPRSIVNKKTNQYKQVETVTRILELDSTTPAVPTAERDVDFTKLGDGTALEIQTVVPDVFDKQLFVQERQLFSAIPPEFRSLLTEFQQSNEEEGQASDPTLSSGETYKSEQNVTEFTRKVETRGIDLGNLPVVLSAQETTEEYGGGRLNSILALTDIVPTLLEGLLVTSSRIRDLGAGLYTNEYKILDDTAWPELVGTEVDPRTGIVVGIKRQVVAAGTLGGVDMDGYHDVKPIDKWRSLTISSKLDPATLPASRTWETTIEHRFPHVLNGAAFLWAAASGTLAYDFDSALVLDITEGYAGPCRAKITEDFYDDPSDIPAVAITQFFPQAYTVGYAWSIAYDLVNECDSCRDEARATARTWPIPPTLHDEIDLGGAVTIIGGSVTGTLPATDPIALPTPGSLITKEVDVEPWRFGVFYRRMVEIYVPG